MLKKYLYSIILGLFTLTSIYLISATLATATQELPSVITSNSILTTANSPYYCENNLIINQNIILTLESNVNVNIDGSLVVKGQIILNEGGKIQVKGNLYRQPGDTQIDEYLADERLVVDGTIFNYIDTTSPIINNNLPISTISRTPEISANFSDNESPIDVKSLKVILDGRNITSQIINKDAQHFSYKPTSPLNFGYHKVQIFISNISGLTATKEWSFKIKDTTPPILTSFTPIKTPLRRPVITATFSDKESGIDIKKYTVILDGQDISSKIVIKENRILSYTPAANLSYGKHYIKYSVTNLDGLTTKINRTMTVFNPQPPKITIKTKLANKTIYNRRPSITFSLADKNYGINSKTLVIKIDNKKIPKKSIKRKNQTYTFKPNYPLNNGKHTIMISVKNKINTNAIKNISFKITTPGFSPGKKELWIEVNQKTQRVYIMKGNTVTKEIKCSSGRPQTPTPNGIFRIQNRGYWFLAKGNLVGAKYWVSFKGYGKYMFHSILFDKSGKYIIQSSVRNLGRKASHGCIRLPLSEAKWIYNNIPTNTRVVIFEK